MTGDELFARGMKAKRESKYIDFKREFDTSSRADWCEIVKDIVAMANTGGGAILIGLQNDGSPSGADMSKIARIDPATITDKVYSYTGYQFSEFEIRDGEKGKSAVVVIIVNEVPTPLVFQKPGTYKDPANDKKQKNAFGKGTVYFRHGAKSEPANIDDIRKTIERRLDEVRREWLSGVQKVVKAPIGAQVTVLPPDVIQSTSPDATPIRISDDPNAPEYRLVDPDTTHPFRRKELVEELNRRLPASAQVSGYDVHCVKTVHGCVGRSEFVHSPRFGSPQYSREFAGWIEKRFADDPKFFEAARNYFKRKRRRRK